jgi:hypothetical protein
LICVVVGKRVLGELTIRTLRSRKYEADATTSDIATRRWGVGVKEQHNKTRRKVKGSSRKGERTRVAIANPVTDQSQSPFNSQFAFAQHLPSAMSDQGKHALHIRHAKMILLVLIDDV